MECIIYRNRKCIIFYTFLTLGKVKVTSLGTVYSQPSLDITVITTPSEGGLVVHQLSFSDSLIISFPFDIIGL